MVENDRWEDAQEMMDSVLGTDEVLTYAEAHEWLDEVINEYPDFPAAYSGKGDLYVLAARGEKQGAVERKNQYVNAIEQYQLAADKGEESVKLFNDLGALNGRIGNYDEQIRYFTKALTVDPDDKFVQKNLQRAIEAANNRNANGEGWTQKISSTSEAQNGLEISEKPSSWGK